MPLWTFLLVWSWKLLFVLEMSLSSFLSQKPDEIRYSKHFSETFTFVFIFRPIFTMLTKNRLFWAPAALWSHCDLISRMSVLTKEEIHSYTTVPIRRIWGVSCQIHRVSGNHSPSFLFLFFFLFFVFIIIIFYLVIHEAIYLFCNISRNLTWYCLYVYTTILTVFFPLFRFQYVMSPLVWKTVIYQMETSKHRLYTLRTTLGRQD